MQGKFIKYAVHVNLSKTTVYTLNLCFMMNSLLIANHNDSPHFISELQAPILFTRG